ncbi:MAG TPA: hypothetical protein VKV04_18975 [Verrucomicrobiae bacterium]|nr:hypothetical protein [Verrucomicrobiae bacterium]
MSVITVEHDVANSNFQPNLISAGLRGAKAGLWPELQDFADQLAEEAVRKTLGHIPKPEKLERYCYKIALHLAFRKNKEHEKEIKAAAELATDSESAAPAPPTEEELQSQKKLAALLQIELPRAFSKLSDSEKAIMGKVYWDRWNSAQIASFLEARPFCEKLSDSGVRKRHRAILRKLLELIWEGLRTNKADDALMLEILKDGPKSLALLKTIREVVFDNDASVELMADQFFGSTPIKLLPKSVRKYKRLATRKEELVGQIIAGVTEYRAALETCRTELGSHVVGDFLVLLRRRVLEILSPSNPNNVIREKLENIYKQSSDDLREFQSW